MARRPSYRPGLRLGAVLLVMAALYATMFGTGHTTPKLGLDLQGGTTVTLTPNPPAGTKVTSGQLSAAVDIIRQRVNGLGVSGADVVRQGTNVSVSVPGKGRQDVLNAVGQTAFLTFREIQQTAATNPPPGGKAVPAPSSAAPTSTPTASPGAAVPSSSASTSATPAATKSANGRVAGSALLGHAAATPTPSARSAAAGTAATTPASAAPSATPSTATSVPAATAPTAAQVSACIKQLSAPVTKGEKDQTSPSPCELTVYAATDCANNGGRPPFIDDNIHHFVVACDRSQGIKYLLKPAQIVGTDVSSVNANLQTSSQGVTTGAWVVDLTFKDKAVSKVESITSRLYNNGRQQLAITLDGVVQAAPQTDGVLGKNIEISGGQPPFTHGEARDLANALKYGSLPVPFKAPSVQTISASLGSSSLRAGLLAGGIGLALVVLYVFLYYRALGLVTVVSLAASGLSVYACVTLLGQAINFTLDLSGIAGLIVSIGITADSFVVFFERLKDELHAGRSPRQAVEYGWLHARRTIYSADTVSFLAALILYLVSIGSVRGFAFTLGLSTLLDVFIVVLFTKPLMSMLIKRRLFSTSRWSGLATVRQPTQPRVAPGARPGSPTTGKA